METSCEALKIAAAAHALWCSARNFEPRVKTLADGTELDIANTPFEYLPAEWRAEGLAGAQSAIEAIALFDDLECAAAHVHAHWVDRNADTADPRLLADYFDLPESEREKDRFFVRLALTA